MVKILVIEDEEDVRSDITEFLELEGFDVLEAPDGSNGIELARSDTPELIICDVMMPKVDGYAVLSELRKNTTTNMIPFIFLTARVTRQDQRYGMTLGADDYITKPFELDDLLHAVNTRLARHAYVRATYTQQMEELRDQLVYRLPHELRTPLVSILGFAELITEDAPDDNIRSAAQTILRAGSRLHRLTENYLLYAQLEILKRDDNRLALLQRQTTAHPEDIVQRIATHHAELEGRIFDLQLDVEDEGIYMSDDNLTRIITELMDNALKFSDFGTSITITGRAEGTIYCLSVRDEGRGMSPEQIQRIDAHVQFDRKLYEQQGAGMGLAIVRELVTLMDGQITINSAINQGTEVQLRLRRAPML